MGTYSSREQFLASSRRGNARSTERYRYAKEALGFPPWKAKLARTSIIALVALAPEGHVFPPELIRREKKGPKRKPRLCERCKCEVGQ